MFDLLWRISGDTSPLKQKVDALGPHFEKAGKKIGDRFHLGIAAGASAAVIAATMALRKALGEAFQDAGRNVREAARLAIPIDEFEKVSLLAEHSARSVDDLVAALKAGGPAAAELRKSMEDLRRVDGPGIGDETSKRLALGSGVMRNVWNGFKSLVGDIAGKGIQAASVLSHGVVGAGAGVKAMLSGGSFSEVLSDYVARGMMAADTDATRIILANQRGKMVDNLLKRDRSTGKQSESSKPSKALAVMVHRPDATTDELSRVGIGTFASGSEQKRYQDQSLKYLRELLAESRKANDLGGGVEV